MSCSFVIVFCIHLRMRRPRVVVGPLLPPFALVWEKDQAENCFMFNNSTNLLALFKVRLFYILYTNMI